MDEELLGGVSALDPSLSTLPQQTEAATNNQQVDQNEFIQLLVTQLQNQDPLDPMSNEEFAVQLAQFSQVEELIGINEKLDAQNSTTDFSSLASYLGTKVTLDSNQINVENGSGEDVVFTLEQNAVDAQIQLLDSEGTIRQTIALGELAAGKQQVPLNNLSAGAGQYTAVLSAVGADGSRLEADIKVSGTVSGYIPGPQPTLLVGEREINTSDILEVRAVG